MNQDFSFSSNQTCQEEWLRILDKGLVTLPKIWREDLGFKPGDLIKAQKSGRSIVLQPKEENLPYRLYTDQEIKGFLKEDRLPKALQKKINRRWPVK